MIIVIANIIRPLLDWLAAIILNISNPSSSIICIDCSSKHTIISEKWRGTTVARSSTQLQIMFTQNYCTLSIGKPMISRHTVVCQRPRKTHGTRNVLFTRTAKSPISASCIFITARQICTKFTYVMPSIYTTSHTKFERNRLSVSRDMYC